MKEEKTGLDEAVSVTANTAQVVSGMVKTGKAVSSAAKGAAVGGPYGAVYLCCSTLTTRRSAITSAKPMKPGEHTPS